MSGPKTCQRISVPVYIEDDDQGFVAHSPALPGCVVGAMTEDEAIRNITEAVKLHLASYIKHGERFPEGCLVEVGIPVSEAVTRSMKPLPGLDPPQSADGRTQRSRRIAFAL